MTDNLDRAQQIEQMQREIALKKHRTFKDVSALYCQDCDEPIPEARRKALPGCSRCTECQTVFEQQKRNFSR